MTDHRWVPRRVFLALLLFAVGLRVFMFVLESLLVPDAAIRMLTLLLILIGLVVLARYYLRRALPRRNAG
jgi:uncharacterized membrane protein YidH (DUF202 family)